MFLRKLYIFVSICKLHIAVYFDSLSLLLYMFLIIRLAEIIERETEAYYKMDPDPFDDRHPGKFLQAVNVTSTCAHWNTICNRH